MKNLETMSVRAILTQHDFPHRFYAYFASQCAKDALSKAKNVDPRSKLAVDVAERFGNGEDFTQEYLQEVIDTASANAYATDSVYTAAASAAYAAASAHAHAAASAHAHAAPSAHAHSVARAAYAAANAASAYAAAHYKPLLLSLIRTRLTEFERIMILN
jgi:hypothetical protein